MTKRPREADVPDIGSAIADGLITNHRAAFDALRGFNVVTADRDAAIVHIATVLAKHQLAAAREDCVLIYGFLEKKVFELGDIKKLKVIVYPAIAELLSIAKENASITYDRCVLLTDGYSTIYTRRHLKTKHFVAPAQVEKIEEMFGRNPNCTALVGGDSGSGKTSLLVGLADPIATMSEMCLRVGLADPIATVPEPEPGMVKKPDAVPTFVVLGSADDIQNIPATEVTQAPDDASAVDRNRYVCQAIAYIVKKTLGRALNGFREGASASKMILYVVLDEMGELRTFVRGMSALLPENLAKQLNLAPSVTIRLIAAGTGVGGSSLAWGSAGSSFELFVAGDTDVNAELFKSSPLGPHVPFDITPFQEFSRPNARLSVIMGNLLSNSFGWLAGRTDKPPKGDAPRYPVDLSALKTVAALHFKASNGLEKVLPRELAGLITQALRLHLFSFMFRRTKVQTTFGMIVDEGRPVKTPDLPAELANGLLPIPEQSLSALPTESTCWCAPAEGHFRLPPFVSNMFALLCGLPWLARSDVGGDSLERFFFAASALAANAAGDTRLYDTLLSSGSLAPLVFHTAKETSDAQAHVSVPSAVNDNEGVALPEGAVSVSSAAQSVAMHPSSANTKLKIDRGHMVTSAIRFLNPELNVDKLSVALMDIFELPAKRRLAILAYLHDTVPRAQPAPNFVPTDVSAVVALVKACRPYTSGSGAFVRLLGEVIKSVASGDQVLCAKALLEAFRVELNPEDYGCGRINLSGKDQPNVGTHPHSLLLMHDFQLHGAAESGGAAVTSTAKPKVTSTAKPKVASTAKPKVTSTAKPTVEPTVGPTVHQRLCASVKAVLSRWITSEEFKNFKEKESTSKTYIAAFRGFAKESFADSFLFMGNTLYTKQYKDTHLCVWTQSTYESERSKMSNTDLLDALKKAWFEATGIQIEHVKYVFVTPTQHVFGAGTGLPRTVIRPEWVHEDDFFVTTANIQFVSFNANRLQGCGAVLESADGLVSA